MKLEHILSDFEKSLNQFKNSPVIWLKGGTACPPFCILIIEHMVRFFNPEHQPVPLTASSPSQIEAALGMSFLGDFQWYVINTLDEFPSAQQKRLSEFLENYEGPHRVVVILDSKSETSPKSSIVEFEDAITPALFNKLCVFLAGPNAIDPLFAAQVFDQAKTISLDEAVMLVHYGHLLGRKHDTFFKNWFKRVIEPEQSLFLLSQHFFAKDIRNFSSAWARISASFPEEFWISYWAEQLWQARLFLHAARERDGATKKFITRLPFSFSQRDWKQYTEHELSQAFSFLYTVDYNLKNGSASCGVDLFCLKFISHQFKMAQ